MSLNDQKARENLIDLAAGRLITDGSTQMVPARKLDVGDVFRVKPDESIPTDGQ